MKMIYRLKINAHLEDHMQGSSSGVQIKVSGAISKLAWIKRKRCEPFLLSLRVVHKPTTEMIF